MFQSNLLSSAMVGKAVTTHVHMGTSVMWSLNVSHVHAVSYYGTLGVISLALQKL